MEKLNIAELLKDLCARLPYGVKCNVGDDKSYTLSRIEIDDKNGHLLDFIEMKYGLDMQVYLSEVKPYLFPLSSMTEEQQKEANIFDDMDIDILSENLDRNRRNKTNIPTPTFNYTDWLNAHHFDYRGLIPKGLALDATDKNIY